MGFLLAAATAKAQESGMSFDEKWLKYAEPIFVLILLWRIGTYVRAVAWNLVCIAEKIQRLLEIAEDRR